MHDEMQRDYQKAATTRYKNYHH